MSRSEKIVVAIAAAAAFWPVWVWFAARAGDGADEKYGLVAILAAAGLAFYARRPARPIDPPLVTLAFLALTYAILAFFECPALIRAVPALAAVGCLVSAEAFGRRWHAGTAALLALGLPLEASLQFYAGYPLRSVATRMAEWLLRACTLDVRASGTLLVWKGESIGVDPPCSGVHMLWVGLFVAALVAAVRGFGAVRTIAAGSIAIALALAANGARVAALFLKEARIVHLPDWTHVAIGAAIFTAAIWALLGLLGRLERWPARASSMPAREPLVADSQAIAVFAGACLLVAGFSLVPSSRADAGLASAFPGWPDAFEGQPLVPEPALPEDARFTRGFPGRFARFSSGERVVLLRWLPNPTRQLHPSVDCFRGSGYRTRPVPSRIGARGERWGCFEAARAGRSFTVCERIIDSGGRSWTDPSSWWWSAALGTAQGPYWAATLVSE